MFGAETAGAWLFFFDTCGDESALPNQLHFLHGSGRGDTLGLAAPNLINDDLPPPVHHLFAVLLAPARRIHVFQTLHGRAAPQAHRPLPPQLRNG